MQRVLVEDGLRRVGTGAERCFNRIGALILMGEFALVYIAGRIYPLTKTFGPVPSIFVYPNAGSSTS